MRSLLAIVSIATFLSLPLLAPSQGCSKGERGRSARPAERDPGLISISVKGKTLHVEVVDTPETMRKGLMYRKSLERDRGMLFVYEEERRLSFWMANTSIPLSIAFIREDGTIVDIQDMTPFDERPHVSAEPAQFALEVNQGWFREHGVRVGDRVSW